MKNHIFLLIFFVLLCCTASNSFCQDFSLLGEEVEEAAVSTNTRAAISEITGEESPVESAENELNNSEVVQKTRNGEMLTQDEFILYVETIEALNPFMGWEQIITKMHALQYPQDTDLKIAGIRLFRNGKENEGWEKVEIPGDKPPKFVMGNNGKKIDIAHAYAGLRAGLNRGAITGWSMGNVNTGWGDSLQVASDRIEAAQSYIAGAFTFDYRKTDKAMDKFSNAKNFKPHDQIRGNELGLELKFYFENNSGRKLSEGFRDVWAEAFGS
jgi:hypothetical protein